MKFRRYLFLLTSIFILGLGVANSADAAPLNQQTNCVIPDAGPWPPCATSGATNNSNGSSCVIPPSGPWPACAKGAATTNNGSNSGACIIPPSGPWPPCATSGSNSGSSSGGDCTIPASGPWPDCAKGGQGGTAGSNSSSSDCVIPSSGPWPSCATGGSNTNALRIISWSALVSPVGDGSDRITFKWNTVGAVKVQLFIDQPSTFDDKYDVLVKGTYFIEAPHSGTQVIEYTDDVWSSARIGIIACDRSSQCVHEEMAANFSCKHAYFFSTRNIENNLCPSSEPHDVDMVYQPFEKGFMLWLSEPIPHVRPNPVIYAFFENGFESYWDDTWHSAEPINDPSVTPPLGKYQPTHGIGKRWRANNFWLREEIGWATQPEQFYTGKIQGTAQFSLEIGKTFYISLPNGQLIDLCTSVRARNCEAYEVFTP